MRLIARIQTAVLSKRVRAQSGAAAKARRRKKTAMPRSLRARGKAPGRAQVRPLPVNLQGFASKAACKRVCPERALQLAEAGLQPPPEGLHTLERQQGPLRNGGQWSKTSAGALRMSFHCTSCGKQAHDSTRLLALARTPCDKGAPWQVETVKHDMRQTDDHWACGRCGHVSDNAHVAAAARARCPVPRFTLAGVDSRDAAWWMRGLLGLAGLYSRAAEPPREPVEALDEAPPAPPRGGGNARQRYTTNQGQEGEVRAAPGRTAFLAAYASHRPVWAAG